jgi:hypothetical protein
LGGLKHKTHSDQGIVFKLGPFKTSISQPSGLLKLAFHKGCEIKGERYTGNTLVKMVRDIMGTQKDSELLKMGSATLARELGSPDKSMSVKGLEMPAWDSSCSSTLLPSRTPFPEKRP